MINLIQQYYIVDNTERQNEIDFCLKQNIDNIYIDKLYLFTNDIIPYNSDKIVRVEFSDRLRYSDFFKYIKNNLSHSENFILANSDIWFDESISLINSYEYISLAITRWDGNQLHWNPLDSQDVWIVKNSNVDEQLIREADFRLGVPGCDNSIAGLFQKYNMQPKNICLKIKCIHEHKSGFRTYQSYDRVHLPYAFLKPE